MIVATFGTTQAKARDSRRKTDLDAFKKALELYKGDTPGSSWYPACPAADPTPCAITLPASFDPALDALYLRDFPIDPEGVNDYSYDTAGSTCNTDIFGDSSNVDGCNGYRLIACLENVNDADAAKKALRPTVTSPIKY